MELRAQPLTELPELSADEIAEMIAAQAALAPAPAPQVLDQAILAALTVKGFTRQSVELRAAAIAESIRGRWDEIVAEVVPAAVAAQPESPVEEPVAEPESVLSEPIAEPGAVEVPSVSSEEELEPEAALVEPVGEPDEGPAPAELEAPTTEIFDGITVETSTGEAIEPEPAEPAAPVPFVPEPHRILVATDGSAAPTNPGPAGWGWYVSETCWAAGAARHSTNNRAELAAMYNLFLVTADTNPPLHFLCNSKYVIGAMNGNRANVNADLVEKLRAVSAGRDFTLEWVKGHNGHPLNEGADEKCTGVSAAVRAGQIIPTGPGWTIVSSEPEPVEAPLPAFSGYPPIRQQLTLGWGNRLLLLPPWWSNAPWSFRHGLAGCLGHRTRWSLPHRSRMPETSPPPGTRGWVVRRQ